MGFVLLTEDEIFKIVENFVRGKQSNFYINATHSTKVEGTRFVMKISDFQIAIKHESETSPYYLFVTTLTDSCVALLDESLASITITDNAILLNGAIAPIPLTLNDVYQLFHALVEANDIKHLKESDNDWN